MERLVVVSRSMLYNGCNELIGRLYVGGEEVDSIDDMIRW